VDGDYSLFSRIFASFSNKITYIILKANMKKEFIGGNKSILVYTCDNLGEYFAEFAKYRKVASESDD
jgi:hypothetical protein